MGPSGSGKSTLLHLLAGLDVPTDGTIEWSQSSDPSALRPSVVALAPQGPSLLAALNAVENVALPLLLLGVEDSEAEERARQALEEVGLATSADQLPEELSGGQLQRVAVARAVVSRPRLLLVDEPTGQQDEATGARLLAYITRSVTESEAALVVSTHDDIVAAGLASRWELNDGHLETGATSWQA